MVQLTRFVRKLRCESRRARYELLFKKCVDFDYKNMNHTPIPESGVPKPTITYEKNSNVKTLDVFDVKNVYRSKEEMDEAIKNNNFDVAKTMHIDSNGKFYMLSIKDDACMPKMRVQNEEKIQLSQTQKLCEMLRKQSMLP